MGDLVWSKNPETGEQAYKPVVELISKYERQIYYLVINTQLGESLEIGTTDDHPFYVPGVGWKSTVELMVGTLIETDGYGLVSVGSIRTYGDVQPTYNFSVADFHTYYVTERNLLVHNENCDLDGVTKGRKDLLGKNPKIKKDRTNTDLENVTDRSTAKSIFRNQTKGQKVQQFEKNGEIRRRSQDGSQIRMNSDASTRIDLPGRGTQPNGETIHLNP